jgi:hypothetical protein
MHRTEACAEFGKAMVIAKLFQRIQYKFSSSWFFRVLLDQQVVSTLPKYPSTHFFSFRGEV